jgi:hypothetical protein
VAVTNVGKLVIEYNLNDPLNTLIKPLIEQAAKLGFTLVLKEGPKEDLSDEAWHKLHDQLVFPQGVPKNLTLLGKVMLSICIKYHKGERNKAYARDIAKEIAQDYPEVAKFYGHNIGKIAFATIFAANKGKGSGLVPKGLLKMDKDENGARRYWV